MKKKHSFYFRNCAQMEKVFTATEELKKQLFSTATARSHRLTMMVNSAVWNMPQVRRKIPKEKIGRKKYLATLSMNTTAEEAIDRAGIDLVELLLSCGVEMVPTTPNDPKYSPDDLIQVPVYLKSTEHFKKITSIINKQYGHGNWHFRGCNRIPKKLATLDGIRHAISIGRSFYNSGFDDETVKNGLKAYIAVEKHVGDEDEIRRALFKVTLMV